MDFKSLINRFTVYEYMITFLVTLALVSALSIETRFFKLDYGFGAKALVPVVIVVITTILLDSFIDYFKTKKFSFPQSALISGLFMGGLLTQNLQWYVYVSAGIIAILSKHLIKFQQKHIFNPANLGILLVSIIFGAAHTWWISSPLILVLLFGIFIIWRLRRFDLTISFLISYYLINSAIELYKGATYSDILYKIINGGVIFFFSMYMLIEPRTHPTAKKQRVIYGILVALFFIGFHQYALDFSNKLATFLTRHDLPLALAVGNIFVPILNKVNFGLKKKPALL